MARFTLNVSLIEFTSDSRAGVRVDITTTPQFYPVPGVGIFEGVDTATTNEEGVATFDLISLPGLTYNVSINGGTPMRVSADQEDGAVVRLDSVVSVTPSPIAAIDAAALRSDLLAELQAAVDAIVIEPPADEALGSRIDGFIDHGLISGAVTFSGPKVSHRFDAVGPTVVTLDGFEEGQVVSLICFSGATDVTIASLPDVALADGVPWAAEFARNSWRFPVASVVEEPAPVEQSPTQPGAITVDPTSSGYNLSWEASTVAAGYEGEIDGGVYSDYGATLSKAIVDLEPGSVHSGSIRAYNTLGERSPARTWGPVETAPMTLHNYIQSLDPILYLRATEGALEDFSPAPAAWETWGGASAPTYTGPALGDGDGGSMVLAEGTRLRRPAAGLLDGLTHYTAIFVQGSSSAMVPQGATSLRWGNGVTIAQYGWTNEADYFLSQPGGVHCHYREFGNNGGSVAQWIDVGGAVVSDGTSYVGMSNPITAADPGFIFLNGSEFGGAGNGGYLGYLVILDRVMTDAERIAFSTAAGTINNPKGGTLP